jgi:hypothetical protein
MLSFSSACVQNCCADCFVGLTNRIRQAFELQLTLPVAAGCLTADFADMALAHFDYTAAALLDEPGRHHEILYVPAVDEGYELKLGNAFAVPGAMNHREAVAHTGYDNDLEAYAYYSFAPNILAIRVPCIPGPL